MSDILERLRLLQKHQQDNDAGEAADTIEALRADNAKLEQAMMALQLLQRAEADVKLRAENAKLRQAMHEIYEVYAGSEGTAGMKHPELYLQGCVQEMAYIAGKHKRAGESDE